MIFSANAQENYKSIDMIVLEKAPVTSHKHINELPISTDANSAVIKK